MAIFCWKQAESRRFADLGTRIVGLMLFFGGNYLLRNSVAALVPNWLNTYRSLSLLRAGVWREKKLKNNNNKSAG